MAALELEPEVALLEDGETVLVRSLAVADMQAHTLLQEVSEERRPEIVQRAMRLGFFALTRLALGGDIDYVEKEFGRFLSQLDARLNPDIKGSHTEKLHALIKEYFDEGGTLEHLFNPQNAKGPLGILQGEIKKEIQGVRDLLVKEEAKEEIWERTAIKGADFEDACDEVLSSIVSGWLGDELERTTHKEGSVQGGRKGDFVVTLMNSQDRMVLEVKDWKTMTLPKILRELDGAMENREAKYAIFVSKYIEALPDKVGWFNEYRKDKLVCALGSRESKTFFPAMLWVACQWGKLRLLEIRGRIEKFDAGRVSQYAEEIRTQLEGLRSIQTKCDAASTALEEVRRIARETERNARERLRDLTLELGLASAARS